MEQTYTYEYLPWRGVTAETWRFFDCKTAINSDGEPVHIRFPYPLSVKCRSLKEKSFWSPEGDAKSPQLFGMDRFNAGSSRYITIYEGETDAASGFQMGQSRYASVSVRSSSSARADCSGHYEYLNSFERIYICFDNDEQGRKAAAAVATLFDHKKVFHVKLALKDANEYLQKGKEKEFMALWWNATNYLPENIISSLTDFEKILRENPIDPGIPYPFLSLQEKAKGIRPGEVVIIKALEGVGKSQLMRELEYHVLKNTDKRLGIIHLEETVHRTLLGIASYELQYPLHLADDPAVVDHGIGALQSAVKESNRLFILNHFGSGDPNSILESIRFLAGACQCGIIFLDHISMVVSGLDLSNERQALDQFSTKLSEIAVQYGIAICAVTHVNDEGRTRGSRNIGKTASTVISLERDVLSEEVAERETIKVTLEKNRFAGETGPAGSLRMNRKKYKLEEVDVDITPSSYLPPLEVKQVEYEF